MDDRDRRRYQDEAEILLARRPWTGDDVDQAALLHDLLETPDGAPDPAAKKLRARLPGELERRLATAENPADRIRYQVFASRQLDVPDPLVRRLRVMLYRGMTSLAEYQSGAHGRLDAAIEALGDLDRAVTAAGPQADALLGSNVDVALIGLASSCYIRYQGRRELLQADLPADREREIRADLDRAIDAGKRIAAKPGAASQAEALTILGACYANRYEDDPRYSGRETIDDAVALLREALRLTEATARRSGQAIAAVYSLIGVRDRLAGALAVRDTLEDVDAAIALYRQNRDYAAAAGLGNLPGPVLSLVSATPRQALRAAQQYTRDHRYATPLAWANFVYVGP
jgi:hypothetical protein